MERVHLSGRRPLARLEVMPKVLFTIAKHPITRMLAAAAVEIVVHEVLEHMRGRHGRKRRRHFRSRNRRRR